MILSDGRGDILPAVFRTFDIFTKNDMIRIKGGIL